MSDSSIVQSLRRSAEAADSAAVRYRKAGRHDDADTGATDGKRWRQLAAGAREVWAAADRAAAIEGGAELPCPGDRVRVTDDSLHHGDEGTLIDAGPIAYGVLLDKDRASGSGGIRIFMQEDLLWLVPDHAAAKEGS